VRLHFELQLSVCAPPWIQNFQAEKIERSCPNQFFFILFNLSACVRPVKEYMTMFEMLFLGFLPRFHRPRFHRFFSAGKASKTDGDTLNATAEKYGIKIGNEV